MKIYVIVRQDDEIPVEEYDFYINKAEAEAIARDWSEEDREQFNRDSDPVSAEDWNDYYMVIELEAK